MIKHLEQFEILSKDKFIIKRWSEFYFLDETKKNLIEINFLYESNNLFKKSVDLSSNNFIDRNTKELASDDINVSKLLSLKYIFEELSVFCTLIDLGYKVQIYPGEQLQILKLLAEQKIIADTILNKGIYIDLRTKKNISKMTTIVIAALLVSILIYLYIGFFYKKSIKRISDIIPVVKNKTASVSNAKEFSASTTATTISLATVIVAFFELVPGLGWWLLWPVITTALGLLFFSTLVKKIWSRMNKYDHRPSLHEFLGIEFSSKRVAMVGSIFTVIGYLTAFAVELTVGARFLASLIPDIPQWITVVVISSVAFIYVSLGGFKATVVTDRVQMIFIWLLLFALLTFYGIYIYNNGSTVSFSSIPDNLKTITWSNSLLAFVLGILFMNLFMYVSNMGLWQRISGSNEPETVVKGMWGSVYKTAISWTLFVVVAVGAFMVVSPVENENLLITLVKTIDNSVIGKITIFTIVLGLYGAMLSTASTQLIAVSHTIYEDILAPYRKINLKDRLSSKKELGLSRKVLFISAVASVGLVEVLRAGGFSVADLAFAIYGAALGMTPAIILSLYWSRDKLRKLSFFAYLSVIIGFLSGWGSAILGKIIVNGNLVFLSPLVGFCTAALILTIGYLLKKNK